MSTGLPPSESGKEAVQLNRTSVISQSLEISIISVNPSSCGLGLCHRMRVVPRVGVRMAIAANSISHVWIGMFSGRRVMYNQQRVQRTSRLLGGSSTHQLSSGITASPAWSDVSSTMISGSSSQERPLGQGPRTLLRLGWIQYTWS